MAKILGLKQLRAQKFRFLEDLPQQITKSFGALVDSFVMIVWGHSGNGKSNFIMQFVKALMPHGKVLYVSLEEGFEASMFATIERHLNEDDHSGLIEFADHNMHFDTLMDKLSKRRSPKFVVIDSLQYLGINYAQYKQLKERFPRKAFIFISHASGKMPDGKTADKVRYDAGIKVRIEGYVAFPISRYGGNTPYVIWEQGARKYWGKKYRSVIQGLPDKKPTRKPPEAEENNLSTSKPNNNGEDQRTKQRTPGADRAHSTPAGLPA